jgi:uncharacterized protein (DUF927 family)
MTDTSVEVSGKQILTDLTVSLREVQMGERAAIWSRVIEGPENIEKIFTYWTDEHEAADQAVFNLQAIRGCAGRARQLRTLLTQMSKDRKRRETSAQLQAIESQVSQVTLLTNSIDVPADVVDPTISSQLHIPARYEINNTGVFKLSVTADAMVNRTKVCSAPIFLAGRTTDVLSGEAKRQIVWRGANGWCSRVIDRRTIFDSRLIMALSAYEAPISSNVASTVVAYLEEFEAENAYRMRGLHSASRMGWLPDGSFLLPDAHYTQEETTKQFSLTPPPGLETMSKGWTAQGSWGEWLEAAELCTSFPLMMISIYAAAAPPMLSLLGLSGFVVDFSGETSGGKSTALKMAASVWGRPSESYPTAMYSWDSTKVWIERCAGFLHNLPLILDETKRAKYPQIVRDVIYDFCQGQGRGRGSVEGTRHTESWKSVLISSGESAATSFSRDAGTRARVLALKGKPLGNNAEVGGRVSEDIQMVVGENYGHLGRKVVEYLVANQHQRSQFVQLYKDTRAKYINCVQSAVARRHASHLSVLEITANIAHAVGLPRPEFDPFDYLVEVINKTALDADQPLSALQEVVSWIAMNQNAFFGRHQADTNGKVMVPGRGWAGVWSGKPDWHYVAIVGSRFREILKNAKYDDQEIIERWAERGWLLRGHGRNITRVISVDGARARCYCLSREVIDQAMGTED